MDACFWIELDPAEQANPASACDYLYDRWLALYGNEPEVWLTQTGHVAFAPGLLHHSEGTAAQVPWLLTAFMLCTGLGEVWYGTDWGGFSGASHARLMDFNVMLVLWVNGGGIPDGLFD